MDAKLIASPFERQSGNWISLPGLGFIVWPLAVIDLPFSMVADTVVLPYTATVSKKK